jgi:hypothetical protein
VNGELAQLCALVSHGNAFLGGQDTDPPELFGANNTFDFVRDVRFVFDGGREVHGTSRWFDALRVGGCERMSLAIARTTPTYAVAFVGGGDWHIHAAGGSTPGAWYGNWAYRRDSKREPWEIAYVTIACAGGHGNTPLAVASARLAAALDVAEAFDRKAEVGFVEDFVRARELLGARDPGTKLTRDLLPEGGYGLEAQQLLGAGATAWVFGGMGWWNDFSPEDPAVGREHEQITQTLFGAVLDAIETAINAFDA